MVLRFLSCLIQRKPGLRVTHLSFLLLVGFLLLSRPVATARAGWSNSQGAQADTRSNNAAQGEKNIPVLELGKPVEKKLAGGETYSYQIMLASGQYLHVIVDQRGIDVAVTLFGPDGKPQVEINSPNLTYGPERVSLIAEAAGNYRLEVRSVEKAAIPGRYEVRIGELRTATAQDRDRIAAQRALTEGLRDQRTAASRRKAVERYEEAFRLWRGVGDRAGEAEALSGLGDVYNLLGERQKALDYYNQSLPPRQAAGDRAREANTLYSIGIVYNLLGEKLKAIESLNQAFPLYQAVGDREGEAITLNAIGLRYYELGERPKALTYYNQALPLRRAVNDRPGEAQTLNNIGIIYNALGEQRKALKFYNEALLLRRATNDRAGEAQTLTNIGVVYMEISEEQKALDTYDQALKIRQALKDRRGEANTLNQIGRVHDLLGDQQAALNFYGQALEIWRAEKVPGGEAQSLNFSGLAYDGLGEKQRALEYYNQALPLRRAVKDRVGEAATLHNLGRVYESLGEFQKAIDQYNQALLLTRGTNRFGEAAALYHIGKTYEASGQKQRALGYFDQALRLSRDIGERNREAKTRYEIARIERDRGDLKKARMQIEKTLDIVESIRANVASQELRTSYLASVQQYYELYIDLLMRMHKRRPGAGFAAAALQANERARARSLLELLAESHADIRNGVAPELVERERELQQQLNAKAAELIKPLGGKQGEEQAVAAAKELEAIEAQLREVQAQIRRTSPRYAALTQPQPLGLREIQQQVLDKDTLLLEYSLGEERSYLWAVTPTTLTSFTLPKREVIEAAARSFYEQLTARNQAQAGGKGQKTTGGVQTDAPGPAGSRKLWDEGLLHKRPQSPTGAMTVDVALSRMLLGPVAAQLGTKRLLIIADGALQYLPFTALPEPVPVAGGKGRRPPLVVKHEVVSLPSTSTLAVLRRETAGRQPMPKMIAVLADPVFEKDDERLKATPVGLEKRVEEPPKPSVDTQRKLVHKSATESGTDGLRIPRLPATRREAEGILALAKAAEFKQAVDFTASRETATSAEFGQYRILHFATHGFLNSAHPELSGIVLSLFDQQGKPQDGFLRMHEIFNLNLPADLVVLSACQTGLGKEIRGEGLVGLTRGFMYAGAPRVVVSLWSVSDQATAELMVRFYKGMLEGKLRPAAALRAAQVALWKEKRWQDPYYWAAFGLQGEWR